MKQQHWCMIICSVLFFVKSVYSSDNFNQYSVSRGKHYNIKTNEKIRGQPIVNSINFLGNGGIFQKHLTSIKRLITSRPTLKQYIIQRREENYFSTVRPPLYVPNLSRSPCPDASRDCILRHLRNRGLIRNTPETSYRRPKQIKLENGRHPEEGIDHDTPNLPSHGYGQTHRGRGHYKPDCWSNDGESDQAPPINYADYSDDGSTKTATPENRRRKRMLVRANRRIAEGTSDPCLWQED